MNFKVYILAISVFVVGMVELVIGGILPLISEDLHVSLSAAGQLITAFALVLAISGPILLALTAKIERKKLYLISLVAFFIGNILAFMSPNFEVLMLARIFTALSASLLIVLSLTIAAKIVKPAYQARAIGVISMGISGSLVLGVPVGVLIGEMFGWRILFLIIAALSIISATIIHRYIDDLPPEQMIPLRQQLASLKSMKIISAHIVTILVLAGHYVLYAYFTPFLQTTMNVNAFMISVAYFVFGVSAVCGGGLGGVIADRFGAKKSILLFVGTFAVVLFVLPLSTNITLLFPIALILWGMLSWALSPAQQSYLIQTAPESAGIQQSFNQSALQLGISLGSAVGGVVIQHYPVSHTAWFGSGIVVIAFLFAIYSITRPVVKTASSVKQAS
ncbi:MFS transporter [Bacillus massiliigorillae]|uniref:MFS transporter n=1 Tax=Bacillus massiliigorillae TaxID=1243664 RepID=UPI0003A4274A|nr:MFS transporter [Bacillus massiliigorillae]